MNAKDRANRLHSENFLQALAELTRLDRELAEVVQRHGPPPLWTRPPGIATLVRIILEQQVSLASGAAIYDRLERHLGDVTARSLLDYGFKGLKNLGITRQKSAYLVQVAEHVSSDALNLVRLETLSDAAARKELQMVKGIGPWTADCYLLMAMRRPDVWPAGDVALLIALQRLKRLSKRPSVEQAANIAASWSPWRAVAARILWHGYLEGMLRPTRDGRA